METTSSSFVEASAPGRLDVMGGIADYSGSLVLQLPIRQRTAVKIKLRDDHLCNIQSETDTGDLLRASIDFRNLLENGKINYKHAQEYFKKNRNDAWIAYIVGCAIVLQKERNIKFKGADFMIRSEIPLGKGVSSSAALEVATMKALGDVFGLSFEGTSLPTLAQRAENLVVGAPCGLMDQLACFFGQPGTLLPILCQPDKVMTPISIPPSVFFMGIDSGLRHSVGGASYTDVRCAAFMGYTMIANLAGASNKDILNAIAKNDFSQLPYHGYLCNIPVEEFELKFKSHLPDYITSEDFLKRYPGTIDAVTSIQAATRYAILNCVSHPIHEHSRVHQFVGHLNSIVHEPSKEEMHLQKMGELMTQSHASYSRCGLGSDRTDEIAERAQGKNSQGIFGAKITGGGNGGTVCVLGSGASGREAIQELHEQMQIKYQTRLALFDTQN